MTGVLPPDPWGDDPEVGRLLDDNATASPEQRELTVAARDFLDRAEEAGLGPRARDLLQRLVDARDLPRIRRLVGLG